MKGKIFKWTAALAVALTLAGGAAGLSPSPVNLSDYSITAEAASHYSYDKQTQQLTLKGTFEFSGNGVSAALGNTPFSSIVSVKLEEGANVTFPEHLSYYLPDLQYVYLTNGTVNYTDSSGGFLSYMKKLQIAQLTGTIFNGSWYEMFRDCPCLHSVDLEIAYDDDCLLIDNLSRCFYGCTSLKEICWNNNFQKDARLVTDMSSMFEGCSSLTYESLMNIARLSNNKLTNTSKMFKGCSSLTWLRMADMNLSNVTRADSMFEGCSSLETLNLSGMKAKNFNFTNPTCWQKMFAGCTSLHTLTLPANFQIRSQMWLPNAGAGCPDELAGWALSNDLFTTVTEGVTANPAALTQYMANQYSGVVFKEKVTLYRRGDWIDKGSCYYYDRVNYVLHLFGNVDDDEVMYMDNAKYVTEVWCEEGTVFPYHCFKLFAHRPNLKKVDINNADTSQVGDMSYMFTHDPSLVEVNAGKIDTSNVYSMEYMFESCTSLEYFYNDSNGNRWNTKNVKYFDGMFAYCTSLREVKADFDPNEITSVEGMFNNCGNLETVVLDENGFDLRGVADEKKANMFADCPNLTSLYLSSNFGGITQDMLLRNDGGGWSDPMRNGIQVSGTGQYAVIDTKKSPTLYHASQFTTIDYNRTIRVKDAPVIGEKCDANGDISPVAIPAPGFKVDSNDSGWYDANTETKMQDECFVPGGGYYLKIRLVPIEMYRFDEVTAANLAKLTTEMYSHGHYYSDSPFVSLYAAQYTPNGELDLYYVVDSGSTSVPLSVIASPKEVQLTNQFIFMNPNDSYARKKILPCYRLPDIYFTDYAFGFRYSTDFLKKSYLEYVCKGLGSYQYSINGGEYQTLNKYSDYNGNLLTGNKPGSKYTFSIRRYGDTEPFVTRSGKQKEANTPVEGGYITDSYAQHMDVSFSAHNVALNNNLGAVYYIPVSDLEGYENVKVIIQKESYDENGKLFYTTEEIKNYTIKDSGYGDEYHFAYNNVAAKEIASNLYATIYAEKDGKAYISKIDRYSVVDYAIKKLNNTNTKCELAVLCADMLNYGAAAQTYFHYNTDHLANSTMTAAHQALATNPNTLKLKSDLKVTPLNGTAKAKFSGKNVQLGSNVSLVFMMQFDDDVNLNNVSLKLTYKTITGQTVTDTVPFKEFVKRAKPYQGKPEYQCSYKSVRAKDTSQPVTAVILINGKPASDTLTYSVQSYAKIKLDDSNTTAELKTIIKALMVYCKSAEAYFKSL